MIGNKKVCLLCIDPQVDFCTGTLAVPGATEDMKRGAKMIRRYKQEIDNIEITMDSHYVVHLANSRSWVDKKGKNPVPIFLYRGNTTPTFLTLEMVKQGEFVPRNPNFKDRYMDYLEKLETNGRYKLMIWPDHCIIGSPGHCIQPDILSAISDWEDKFYALAQRLTKGSNPFTEHYSAVRADVIDPSDESTALNTDFINILKIYDIILLIGEALSHCCANTYRDIFAEFGADQVQKFVLLKDATSSVPGCESIGQAFIDEFTKSPYNMKVATTLNPFEHVR
jgi:nicotinamidase-related amidase